MLLPNQLHRQGGVVVQQIEEAQPTQPHQLHRRAGHGIAAMGAVLPDHVLIAEQLAGAVAELVAGRVDHLDDAAAHAVDGIGRLTAAEDGSAGGEGHRLAVHLGGHQLDRRGNGDCGHPLAPPTRLNESACHRYSAAAAASKTQRRCRRKTSSCLQLSSTSARASCRLVDSVTRLPPSELSGSRGGRAVQ